MGSRIRFDEGWFRDEEIDGFMVKAMMKRYWASELEILFRIDALCEELGIRYFANWGTLLGAVRHGGFIPWDDDIDITMLRDDYQIFSKAAREGKLPDGLCIKEDFIDPDYENLVSRVVNGLELTTDDERMNTYHGCPYISGVDIDVLDDMALDDEASGFQRKQIKFTLMILETIRKIENGTESKGTIDSTVKYFEETMGISLNKALPVKVQLHRIINMIGRRYKGSGSDSVTFTALRVVNKAYDVVFEKNLFKDLKRIPFGPISVPVPRDYHKVLSMIFGEEYMTPVRFGADHDYPLYKDQEEVLRQELIKRKMSGEMFGIETGY